MGVEVDEAREHVHPCRVDLPRRALRAAPFVDRDAGIPHAPDLRDPVPLDHDVDRPDGRRARPVDQRRAADDQPLERSLALARPAGRRLRDAASTLREGAGGADEHGDHGEKEGREGA